MTTMTTMTTKEAHAYIISSQEDLLSGAKLPGYGERENGSVGCVYRTSDGKGCCAIGILFNKSGNYRPEFDFQCLSVEKLVYTWHDIMPDFILAANDCFLRDMQIAHDDVARNSGVPFRATYYKKLKELCRSWELEFPFDESILE